MYQIHYDDSNYKLSAKDDDNLSCDSGYCFT